MQHAIESLEFLARERRIVMNTPNNFQFLKANHLKLKDLEQAITVLKEAIRSSNANPKGKTFGLSFNEAVQALKDGKLARRSDGQWIGLGDTFDTNYRPTIDDMISNDWQVVDLTNSMTPC